MPFIAGLAFALGIALAAAGALPGQAPGPGTATCADPSDPAKAQAAALSPTQVGNARTIYNVATSLGLPQYAAVVAIATAMQESQLTNLRYGNADSLGLFQQRPSQGWGSPAQIIQPVYATTAFYGKLVQVPGWQGLPVTVAAQDVQRSAYPDAYAQWQQLATALVAEFSGQAAACATDNGAGTWESGTTKLPRGFTQPRGASAAVDTAVSFAVAQLGKPYVWGAAGPAGYDCSGLIMKAYGAAGISLPRTTFQQVNTGRPVYSLGRIRPGDLLFTPGSDGTPENPGHVGMYLGSGRVIEAPQTGEKIMITPLAGYWARDTVAIRRIA